MECLQPNFPTIQHYGFARGYPVHVLSLYGQRPRGEMSGFQLWRAMLCHQRCAKCQADVNK